MRRYQILHEYAVFHIYEMGIDIRLERYDVYTHCLDMRCDDDDSENTVDDIAPCAVADVVVVVVADVVVASHIYKVGIDIESLETYVYTHLVDMKYCIPMQSCISTHWVQTYVSREPMSKSTA